MHTVSPPLTDARLVGGYIGRDVVASTADRIRERFVTAVTTGRQCADLPLSTAALGQYLPPHDSNQRGLFGQAAALVVIGHQDDHHVTRDALLAYLLSRSDIEESLPGTDADLAITLGKLDRERRDTFKAAEIVRAVAMVRGVANGRETTLHKWTEALMAARGPRGWGATLESSAPRDSFATAMACRALAAAGIAIDAAILDELVLLASPEQRLPLRIQCLLALAEAGRDDLALAGWEDARDAYLADLQTAWEYIHRYRIGDRVEPIHIPHQLLGLQLAGRFEPGRWWTRRPVQQMLRTIIVGVRSPQGFAYEQGGPSSSRTYSVIYEVLLVARAGMSVPSMVGTVIAWSHRAARLARRPLIRLMAALPLAGVIVWAVLDWLQQPEFTLGQIAPNIIWAALAGVLLWVVGKPRR